MLLHAFLEWVHSTFPEKEILKLASNRTHRVPIFNYEILNRDRKEFEEEIARYTSTKTILMSDMGKPKNNKYDCYRVPLDTWVGWIGAVMRLKEPYA